MIPSSVTSIDNIAFSFCSSLTNITIENPECEIVDSESTIFNGFSKKKGNYYNGVIRGYENSTTQAYAEKYGYEFECMGKKPTVTI